MGRTGWEDVGGASAAPPTAQLDGDATAEVVVVGLGASGLEAVRHLAARGADVLGLEAHTIGAGAAGRNGGFLLTGGALFHDEAVRVWGADLAVALYRASTDELHQVRDRHPDLVRPTGSLRIADDEDEARSIRDQLLRMRLDGLAVDPYDGPEGHGLLISDDAHVQPLSRCRELARSALEAGARLATHTAVHGIGNGVVHTTHGVVRTTRVLIAIDGGLEHLLPELTGRVRTARLQMLATAPTAEVAWPRPIYRRQGLDYLVQLPTGEVLVGGGRDVGGEAEWDSPAEPSPSVQAYLDELVSSHGVTSEVTHRWAGRSAFTEDRLPICEEVRPGVAAVGAYSGHGNLLGTRAARVAADALLDGRRLSLTDLLGT